MKKLLIVNTSAEIINTLKELFSKENNFTIYTANSLDELVLLIKKEDFFLVISNTLSSGSLNIQLLEILKKNKIPTILISSKIDDDLIELSSSPNIVDYVLNDTNYGLEYIYMLVNLLLFIKGLNVLLVSQSMQLKSEFTCILESLFLNIKLADDGKQALEIMDKDYDISLVISDYEIPFFNGLELTENLRKNQKYSNLPILILKEEANDNLKIKLYKSGINDFILKPVLKEELKSKVINLFLNVKKVEEINYFSKIFDDNIISSSTDTKGLIQSVSSAFCKISGYEKDELIGSYHNIVRHPDMPESIYVDLWKTIKEDKTWKGELKNLRKDGSSYWVSSVIEPIFDKQKHKIGYSAVRQDITDKRRIYELSITDGLTSLYNRRYFNDIAEANIKKILKSGNIFGFMILDIDNFKKYNDSYGHQEGDNVLINISNSLNKSFRRNDDLIFRLGGEEFGVLINSRKVEDIINLVNLAKNNIQSLKIEHKSNSPFDVVTASFGLIIINKVNEGSSYKLDYIYKQADDRLYEAKDAGRNTIKYKII